MKKMSFIALFVCLNTAYAQKASNILVCKSGSHTVRVQVVGKTVALDKCLKGKREDVIFERSALLNLGTELYAGVTVECDPVNDLVKVVAVDRNGYNAGSEEITLTGKLSDLSMDSGRYADAWDGGSALFSLQHVKRSVDGRQMSARNRLNCSL